MRILLIEGEKVRRWEVLFLPSSLWKTRRYARPRNRRREVPPCGGMSLSALRPASTSSGGAKPPSPALRASSRRRTRNATYAAHENTRTLQTSQTFSPFVRPARCAHAGVFVCGEGRFSCPAARGGAARRDAMRRTGRDEVSGPGAAYRIMVAKQPASPADGVRGRA